MCLYRKDPSAFFSFPVTDFIAPGYSMIIKHPMDFSTMKEKIKNNDYQSIEELKVIVISSFILFYNGVFFSLTWPWTDPPAFLHLSGTRIMDECHKMSLKSFLEK